MTALSPAAGTGEFAEGRTQLEFDDNLLLPVLYGERDQHLDRIERQLGVSVVTRGNRLAISGPASATEAAHLALSQLYERLKRGQEVDLPAVEAAIRLAEAELGDRSLDLWREDAAFRTRKRRIMARSPGQAARIPTTSASRLRWSRFRRSEMPGTCPATSPSGSASTVPWTRPRWQLASGSSPARSARFTGTATTSWSSVWDLPAPARRTLRLLPQSIY